MTFVSLRVYTCDLGNQELVFSIFSLFCFFSFCVCVSLPVSKDIHKETLKAGGPGISLLTWSNKARQRDGKWLRTLNHVPAGIVSIAVRS